MTKTTTESSDNQSTGNEGGMPKLLFDESAARHIISAFEWEITELGYITDGDEFVPSIQGDKVHYSDLAGIIEYEGKPRPLTDDFTELAEYAQSKHGQKINKTKDQQ